MHGPSPKVQLNNGSLTGKTCQSSKVGRNPPNNGVFHFLGAFHGPPNLDKYSRRFAWPLAQFAPLGRWIPFFLLNPTDKLGSGGAQVVTSWAVHPSRFILDELPVLIWSTSIVPWGDCPGPVNVSSRTLLILAMFCSGHPTLFNFLTEALGGSPNSQSTPAQWAIRAASNHSVQKDESTLPSDSRCWTPLISLQGRFCALHGFTQPTEHTSKVNDTTDEQ